VWLTLGQRTLRYETYVMPAPEENHVQLYEHVLRRNDRLVGAHFSIGVENAIFLRGEVPGDRVDRNELDRVLGTLYAQVEQCFTGNDPYRIWQSLRRLTPCGPRAPSDATPSLLRSLLKGRAAARCSSISGISRGAGLSYLLDEFPVTSAR